MRVVPATGQAEGLEKHSEVGKQLYQTPPSSIRELSSWREGRTSGRRTHRGSRIPLHNLEETSASPMDSMAGIQLGIHVRILVLVKRKVYEKCS